MKIKQAEFQPRRLTQARAAKMLNMSELADRTGLTRQAISQYEKGITSPSPHNLRRLSAELGISERLLTRPMSFFELKAEGTPSFRSLASSTSKARQQALTHLEWLTLIASDLSEYVILPDVKLPSFNLDDFINLTDTDIEEIAANTRKHFSIGNGPISDITLLLENHGVIIGHVPLHAKLDGLSAWFNGRPFILVNSKSTAVRIRFDLAHELGHIILHRNSDESDRENKALMKLMEKQAHYFAGAFLMPEGTLSSEVYGIDLDSLVKLKERWKVSIAAIVMRLASIDMISENRKYKLFQLMSARHMRRHEPLDSVIEKEKPRLIKKIIKLIHEERLIEDGELFEKIPLPSDFFAEVSAFPIAMLECNKRTDNVIELRRR